MLDPSVNTTRVPGQVSNTRSLAMSTGSIIEIKVKIKFVIWAEWSNSLSPKLKPNKSFLVAKLWLKAVPSHMKRGSTYRLAALSLSDDVVTTPVINMSKGLNLR